MQTLQPEPENPATTNTAELPLTDPVTASIAALPLAHTPTASAAVPPLTRSQHPATASAATSLSDIHTKVVEAICGLGFEFNENTFDLQGSLVHCVPELSVSVPPC